MRHIEFEFVSQQQLATAKFVVIGLLPGIVILDGRAGVVIVDAIERVIIDVVFVFRDVFVVLIRRRTSIVIVRLIDAIQQLLEKQLQQVVIEPAAVLRFPLLHPAFARSVPPIDDVRGVTSRAEKPPCIRKSGGTD